MDLHFEVFISQYVAFAMLATIIVSTACLFLAALSSLR